MNILGTTVVMSRFSPSRLIYYSLLIFRLLVGPFLLGYIHPDEFFQGGQELFFGCPPTIPWEFEPTHALRSVIPPTIMTWLPLQIYRCLLIIVRRLINRDGMTIVGRDLSGTEILVVPRIACSMLSILFIDWSLWTICDTGNPEKKSMQVPIPVLLVASAWPTVVMLNRPFSNSMESYILALLMITVFAMKTEDIAHPRYSLNNVFCWKIGMLCAFGIFTRFTFVFFAIPILLFLLSKMIQISGVRNGIFWKRLGCMAISFACISLVIIQADTLFYSLRRHEGTIHSPYDKDLLCLSFDHSSTVVTPFNAFTYNSQTSNLKDHGLHPRWTHAVLNMMMMYGPLTIGTYLLLAANLRSVGRIMTSNLLTTKTIEQNDVLMVSAAIIVFGLGFLSIAPHQEPRFLLPLLIPLALLGEKPVRRFPATATCIWIIFNLIMLIFFGVLHQGGVNKSLLAIGSTTLWDQQKQPTAWIYMRTYMPPTFLTRRDIPNDRRTCSNDVENDDQTSCKTFRSKLDSACQEEKVHIIDLKSASIETLREAIQTEIPCSDRNLGSNLNDFLYLVVPFIGERGDNLDCDFILSPEGCDSQFELSNKTYEWNRVSSYGPHLTTEDFPPFGGSIREFYNKLALNVYKISCAVVDQNANESIQIIHN